MQPHDSFATKVLCATSLVVGLLVLLVSASSAATTTDASPSRFDEEALNLHPTPTQIRSLASACAQEVARFCPTAPSSAHLRVFTGGEGEMFDCLAALPPSKISTVCNSWVNAYDACKTGLRRRGTPCDLNKVTMQHCLKDVQPSRHMQQDCTGHEVFHQAKAMSPARKRHHF